MVKKILITGSGGFVGKNLYKILKKDNNLDVFGIGKTKKDCVDRVVDISDEKTTIEVLDEFRPDQIVHLAALSNVEKCETERGLANRQNILPVKILSEWARKNDKKIIFISTDYVFDGVKGNFDEGDSENPLQYYGQTKLEGEKIVSSLPDYIILRLTVIYGWDPGGMNFFMQLYRNQMAQKEMRAPIDQISNPTFVVDLCNLIKKIIETENKSGIYIATGSESVNRYEFALKICDFMNWDKNLLIPVKTSELKQIAKRPLNNSTISQKVCETFNFKFNNFIHNFHLIKKMMENISK